MFDGSTLEKELLDCGAVTITVPVLSEFVKLRLAKLEAEQQRGIPFNEAIGSDTLGLDIMALRSLTSATEQLRLVRNSRAHLQAFPACQIPRLTDRVFGFVSHEKLLFLVAPNDVATGNISRLCDFIDLRFFCDLQRNHAANASTGQKSNDDFYDVFRRHKNLEGLTEPD